MQMLTSSQSPRSPFPSHYWVQRAKDAIVDSFREHAHQQLANGGS